MRFRCASIRGLMVSLLTRISLETSISDRVRVLYDPADPRNRVDFDQKPRKEQP